MSELLPVPEDTDELVEMLGRQYDATRNGARRWIRLDRETTTHWVAYWTNGLPTDDSLRVRGWGKDATRAKRALIRALREALQ